MTQTISYSNKVNGWTSFHSFNPQFMIGMNNKLYSFSGGDLWEHHSDDVMRNTYYGKHYQSKVSVVMNESPSDVKFLKAIGLESNDPWLVNITAYEQGNDDLMLGRIHKDEFVKKEGLYTAYARRNEDNETFDNKSAYGLGIITEVSPYEIIINNENHSLSIGDKIYTESSMLIGTVRNARFVDNSMKITLDNDPSDGTNLPNLIGVFTIGVKNSRTEGSMLRGYSFKYELINDGFKRVELYAVNSEVEKSFI